MNPLDAFDGILRSLHQAMLDDAHWPATAALIDEACGMGGNGLAVGGDSGDDVRLYFAGLYRRGERRQDLEREYFEVYYPHDERAPRLRRAPDGQLIHVPDLYTEEELKTSPAYNEGARRLGSQNGLNVRFDGPGGMHIVWATADPVATGGWQSAELRLIEYLLPHIRQFVRIRQALAGAGALGAGLAGLLENSRIGVIHLDRGGRVVAMNARARDILRRGDGLFDRSGTLHAWLPADHDRLQRLLKRALPALWGEPPTSGYMTVKRAGSRARLGLHVNPVNGGQTDFGGRWVTALVLVVDPASRPRIDPVRVATTLGLTPSEGRVAALLAEGRSVREIAAATGYQESYVRWLLKQVYKKQGLSGQVALVRLVLATDALPWR